MNAFSKRIRIFLALSTAVLPQASFSHVLNQYIQRTELSPTAQQNIRNILACDPNFPGTCTDKRDEQGKAISSLPSECPKTQKLVERVFERIVASSSIDRIREFYPQLSLSVKCRFSAVETQLLYGEIQVSFDWIQLSTTEDELAFALAHELAHFTLGHDIGAFFEPARYDADREHQADLAGLELLSRANYDSRGAIRFFKHDRKQFGKLTDSTHGTAKERLARMRSEIELHHYLEHNPIKDSLIEAKLEIAISSRLKVTEP